MATKKKTTKKKSTKKVSRVKAVKKTYKKIRKTPIKTKSLKIAKPKKVRATKRKIILVLTRLIFFAGLSLVSFVLYLLMSNTMLKNLFSLLAMIFGFVSVGLLIVLLIFLILKALRK